jgi:hypothetical protein
VVWDAYIGRYRLPGGLALEIARDGGALFMHKTGGSARPLKAELADVLFVPGDPRIRYLVKRGADKRVEQLIQRRESWDLAWDRVS